MLTQYNDSYMDFYFEARTVHLNSVFEPFNKKFKK